MLTKKVFARLALGGVVKAQRTMPFPWRFFLESGARAAALELSDDDVVALLKRHAITPPKRIGFTVDAYSYDVIDRDGIQATLAEDYTYGFGQCAVCGDIVAATKDLLAARHGFTTYHSRGLDATDGRKHTEACSGTGAKFATLVVNPAQAKRVNERHS